MKKIRDNFLNLFFRNPYIIDLFISIIVVGIFHLLCYKGFIKNENFNDLKSISSNISNSSITIAGFVLTILTIVVTFKSTEDSNSQIKNDADLNDIKPISTERKKIKLFFSSDLYYKTVKILQQSVTGQTLIFTLFLLIQFFDKSISSSTKITLILIGITTSTLIVLRCILTLKLIINLQKGNK